MTARRAKRTPTPKATGTALRTTPGGRASATPKNQCRRLNAETRGRRAPARAEAIAPRLVPPRPAQQRPRRAEAIGGQELQAEEIRDARAYAEATTGSRCDAIQTGFHAQRAWLRRFQNRGRPKPLPTEAGGFRRTGNVRGSRDTRAEDRPRESNLRQLFPEFLYFTVKVT